MNPRVLCSFVDGTKTMMEIDMLKRAEGIFSNLKRTFGQFVAAREFKNMVQEMMLKALRGYL